MPELCPSSIITHLWGIPRSEVKGIAQLVVMETGLESCVKLCIITVGDFWTPWEALLQQELDLVLQRLVLGVNPANITSFMS